MVGITSAGIYVPSYRLKAETIASAWGKPPAKGERAVANHDEDSLTMAFAAAYDALRDGGMEGIGGLYFASTTSPYAEKSVSSFIATALDLPPEARTADFGGSLRAGSAALLGAIDAVKGGSASKVVVTAADCRLAAPGSGSEPMVADGAASVSIGNQEVMAEFMAYCGVYDEYADSWRKSVDYYFGTDDARFAMTAGYAKNVRSAVKGLLNREKINPADISKVVLVAPDLRGQSVVAREVGLDPSKLADGFATSLGFFGCAHPLIGLISALNESNPGDLILMVSYGDGADALLLKVTQEVDRLKRRELLKRTSAYARELKSYTRFLNFRRLIRSEELPYSIFTSTALTLREREQNLKLYALRCLGCGNIYPLRIRVCQKCHNKDKFEKMKLARKGKVFTYTQEHYYPSPDGPITMAVVDLEGGGRLIFQMTDADPAEAKVGLEVELTLRRLHEAGGYYNYYWKCRPVRAGEV